MNAQYYSNKGDFTYIYHMHTYDRNAIGESYIELVRTFGISNNITLDGAMVQEGIDTNFMMIIRKYQSSYYTYTPYRPNENPSKGYILELKRK